MRYLVLNKHEKINIEVEAENIVDLLNLFVDVKEISTNTLSKLHNCMDRKENFEFNNYKFIAKKGE